MKLSSVDGLDRGATKQIVYDSARFSPVHPTRLFIDAVNTATWRDRKFYPVLNERSDSEVAALDNSVLAKMLQLKRDNPLPEQGKLSDDFTFELDRDQECPAINEFVDYREKHPMWGMPYGMPGLSLKQEFKVLKWLQEGAKVAPSKPLSKKAYREIDKWEHYLNGSTKKQQLVARYIYEHLFIGQLHFKDHPDHEFYKLVRSRSAPGQPLDEIATVRPYDHPGVSKFYYRLRPIVSTIIDKIHFVYELSDQRKHRYDQLFFSPDYEVTSLPSYDAETASNPFKTFGEIPNNSRHQFLLDDAEYFISGFIKGPSCRGQIALNSIRDRFWVIFTKPNQEYKTEISKILEKNSMMLSLPGKEADNIGLLGFRSYDKLGREYMEMKDKFIRTTLTEDEHLDLSYIWDGDQVNQNAALTIFRHFDSATVTKGLIGDTPLTAWVVDYTIIERLHYLLVAGFNVYGTAGHGLASRAYMGLLRMDAENNLLRFLPSKQRKQIHDSWYLGSTGLRWVSNFYNVEHETGIIYQSDKPKTEFFAQVRDKLGPAAGPLDTINNCHQESCVRNGASPLAQQVDKKMRELAQLSGLDLVALPEMSFIRVKTENSEQDMVYTLLIDKALKNVSVLLREDSRRLPKQDTLTVVPGFIGSYPNFFFSVDLAQLSELIHTIKNAKEQTQIDALYSRFGIRRNNPEFWQYADWFNEQHKHQRGLRARLFDLNRYSNL